MPYPGTCTLSAMRTHQSYQRMVAGVFFPAEVLVRSTRKLFNYIIWKKKIRIKVSKKTCCLILKTEALMVAQVHPPDQACEGLYIHREPVLPRI